MSAMTGNNGQPQINPNTGQPYSYLEAYQAGKQAAQDTKPDKSNPTEVIKRKVGGVDHNILIDKVTGKGIQDWPQLACKENSPRRWFLMPRNAKGPIPTPIEYPASLMQTGRIAGDGDGTTDAGTSRIFYRA